MFEAVCSVDQDSWERMAGFRLDLPQSATVRSSALRKLENGNL